MTNIYNLFKFLADKEGKTPKPDVLLKVKLTHAPETLTPEELNLEGSLIIVANNLPDNLHVEKNLTLTTSATTLPKNLQVGGDLTIYSKKIKALPEDLKVGGTVDITYIENIKPADIPKNLRGKIKWNYGTFEDFNAYINLPTVDIPGIGKNIRGRKLELRTLKDIPGFGEMKKYAPNLTTLLEEQPIGNIAAYSIYIPESSNSVRTSIVLTVKLPQLPLPLTIEYMQTDSSGYNPYYSSIRYKNKNLKVNTFESEFETRGLDGALGRLVPGYNKQEIPKHLQNEKGKILRLAQIIDREQEPVSMNLGRKERGGLGVKGQYKDYALAFSPEAQNHFLRLAKKLGVKWGDFIAYRYNNHGDANFVVKGESSDGKVYYVNKYGSGQGGTFKLYDENFREQPMYD